MKQLQCDKNIIGKVADKTRCCKIERTSSKCDVLQRSNDQGSVPAGQGKKPFDKFMKEANEATIKQKSTSNRYYLKKVYLAARSLDFNRFLIFLGDSIK